MPDWYGKLPQLQMSSAQEVSKGFWLCMVLALFLKFHFFYGGCIENDSRRCRVVVHFRAVHFRAVVHFLGHDACTETYGTSFSKGLHI